MSGPALVTVWDRLYTPGGQPVNGKQVTVVLSTDGTSTNPVTQVPHPQPVYSAVTAGDPNDPTLGGYWAVQVIPTDQLTPAGLVYTVIVEGFDPYQINPTSVAVPPTGWQSSSIKTISAPGQQPPNQLPAPTTALGSLAIRGPRPYFDISAYVASGGSVIAALTAIYALMPNNGGTILFPAGDWNFDALHTVPTTITDITWLCWGSSTRLNMTTAAAGIVATSTTRFKIAGYPRIIGFGASTSSQGSIFAQNATDLRIEARFEGGGPHVSLNGCTGGRMDTHHVSLQKADTSCLTTFQCTGVHYNCRSDAFVFPAGGVSNLHVFDFNEDTRCTYEILDTRGCDLSTAGSGIASAIRFQGVTKSRFGQIISCDHYAADGVSFVASGGQNSSDIVGGAILATGNGRTGGAGVANQNGDGVDFFNCDHIEIGAIDARFNGANGHNNLEFVNANDISIGVAEASDCQAPSGESVAFSNANRIKIGILRSNRSHGAGVLIGRSVICNDITINSIEANDNNQDLNAAVAQQSGVHIAQGGTGIIIGGGKATDTRGGGAKTQQQGIRIENNSVARLRDIDCSGNVNALGIIDSGTKCYISGCKGFNPRGWFQGTQPAIPADGTVFTNPKNCDSMVFLTANAGGACTIQFDDLFSGGGTHNAITVAAGDTIAFRMSFAQQLRLSYGANAPTWSWVGD